MTYKYIMQIRTVFSVADKIERMDAMHIFHCTYDQN